MDRPDMPTARAASAQLQPGRMGQCQLRAVPHPCSGWPFGSFSSRCRAGGSPLTLTVQAWSAFCTTGVFKWVLSVPMPAAPAGWKARTSHADAISTLEPRCH